MRTRACAALLFAVLAGCRDGATSTPGARVVRVEAVHQLRAAPVVAPRVVPQPPVACRRAVACVDTAAHRAWLLQDGRVLVGPVRVALGSRGHRTPRGRFSVLWKDADHTSSSYGISMNHSVFFAGGGIAFHEGTLAEPSHGCVHLSAADATTFFDQLHRGDRVVVS